MLIINVKNGGIERSLKELKNKFMKTNIGKECLLRKEFIKKSIKKRSDLQKAIYTQNKKRNND